jgi:tetratricopeptide (TPR) repeat protein
MREEMLRLSSKVYGPKHPRTLGAMINLGISYDFGGREGEALKMREEVLKLSKEVNGPKHRDTLNAMFNLWGSYHHAGRQEEALQMIETLVELRLDLLGPEHTDTLRAMGNLVFSYHHAGRRDKALEMGEKLLDGFSKASGPRHPNTIKSMLLLADSYHIVGRQDEALEMREEVLPLSREVLGPEHSETLKAMARLAISLRAADRLDEAAKLLSELEALQAESAGENKTPTPAPRHQPLPERAVKEVIVAPTSEWRWLHPVDGVDPAEADPEFHRTFFIAKFDDAEWQEGTDSAEEGGGFGYGEYWFVGVDIGLAASNELGKSAYFRHRFSTEKEHTHLELRCQRDDGIIVYLDGKEVARDNLGEGEEAYGLASATAVEPSSGAPLAERTIHRIPLKDLTLPAGEHILAISLHNSATPSFDLRIGGITLVEVESGIE